MTDYKEIWQRHYEFAKDNMSATDTEAGAYADYQLGCWTADAIDEARDRAKEDRLR